MVYKVPAYCGDFFYGTGCSSLMGLRLRRSVQLYIPEGWAAGIKKRELFALFLKIHLRGLFYFFTNLFPCFSVSFGNTYTGIKIITTELCARRFGNS